MGQYHYDYHKVNTKPSTLHLQSPSCPRSLLQNNDDCSHLAEMETEAQRETFQSFTAHQQQNQHSNPGPGIHTTSFQPMLPVTSLFIPVGKPKPQAPGLWVGRGGGGDGHPGPHDNTISCHTRPRALGDGVAHMTQPQSQRELCALCPRPASPTHRSSPGWRKRREPDISKMWG